MIRPPSIVAVLALTTFCSVIVQHVSCKPRAPSLFGVARGGGKDSTSTSSSTDRLTVPFPTWTFDEPSSCMEWTEMPAVHLDMSSADTLDVDLNADLIIIGISDNNTPADSDDDDEDDSANDDKEKSIDATLTGRAKDIDGILGGALTQTMLENDRKFKGGAKCGSVTPTIRVYGNGQTRRYMLVGLGKIDSEGSTDPTKCNELGRKVGSAVAAAIQSEKGIASCSVVLPRERFATSSSLSALSSAFTEKLYVDNRYRTGSNVKKETESIERVTLVIDDDAGTKNVRTCTSEDMYEAISEGRKIASGVYLARDIVNSPHNVLNSLSLADTAQRIASESSGLIECNILEKEDCERLGMGSYLGVARGSETKPKFIHLTYRPRSGNVRTKVGIIGKGLLFDTGGYNIKTSSMHLMKFDCGGAAAVLGAARAIAALAPDGVEANIIVAACENMINDRAVLPGDILTASNGKTIEVENTDAEGRLTMADVLVYADKEIGCKKIIELSTLTGACMVALGNKIAGVWAKDESLVDELLRTSSVTAEKLWHMPLEKDYNDLLKSKIADLKNLGGRYGGAITAALFLQHFVGKKTPFAHIDIAGPVWSDKLGATGFGAKLVTDWVCRQGTSE